MESIDYIFIFCCILPLIPKDMMMESKEINIKRGKIIGSIIGIVVGIFICYYLTVNGYFDFLVNI
jgi:hypothetical protein